MCQPLAQGGRRCNGGKAGNAKRRRDYTHDQAIKALRDGDDNRAAACFDKILRQQADVHAAPRPIPADQVVNAARVLATHAHDGQFRRDGRPYIVHPADVAHRLERAGMPAEVVAAGWMHDVAEDTRYGVDDMRTLGFPERTTSVVRLVTHEKGEDYRTKTMARAVSTLDAAAVKDADNQNNTSDRFGPPPSQLAKQVQRDLKYLEARRTIKARLYESEDGQRELARAFANAPATRERVPA